jgi:hypothetical protein
MADFLAENAATVLAAGESPTIPEAPGPLEPSEPPDRTDEPPRTPRFAKEMREELNHDGTTGTTEENKQKEESASRRRLTQFILIGVYLHSSAVSTFSVFPWRTLASLYVRFEVE